MNWDMLGHEWAVTLLKEMILRGTVRHAYLFTGPQGVGRRTLAIRFAQALNCPEPREPGEPCLSCRTCRQIGHMQHPDLAVVQAERRGGVLKVEQVRELERSLILSPYEARYRVALLLHFEEANPSAMNALLKTLEEPAPQVVLVLTAESAESLLPTIASRCEVLRLRPVAIEQVSDGLKSRWDMPEDQANLLAALSGGRPGYAMQLYLDPKRLEQRSFWLDEHQRMLQANRVERYKFAEGISKSKSKESQESPRERVEYVRNMLEIWLSYWRDVLLSSAGVSQPLANIDRKNEIQQVAQVLSLETAKNMVSALERSVQLLEQNVNLRLTLEVLMLDLPAVCCWTPISITG